MNQQWSYYSQRIVTCTVSLAVMMLIVACGGKVTSTPLAFTPTIKTTITIIKAYGIGENGAGVAFVAPHSGGDRHDYIIAMLAGSYDPQKLIIFVTETAKFVQVKQLSPGMTVQLISEVHPATTSEATSSTAKAMKNNPGAINDELEATQISLPDSNDPNGGVVTYQGQTTQDVSTDNMLHFNVGPNLSYDFAIDPKVLSTAQSFKSGQFIDVSVVFTNSQGKRCNYSDTGCTGTVESVK